MASESIEPAFLGIVYKLQLGADDEGRPGLELEFAPEISSVRFLIDKAMALNLIQGLQQLAEKYNWINDAPPTGAAN